MLFYHSTIFDKKQTFFDKFFKKKKIFFSKMGNFWCFNKGLPGEKKMKNPLDRKGKKDYNKENQ